jgi:hypothetical protein
MTTTAAERAVLGRRWERVTEWSLAAVVFLAAYTIRVFNPNLPSGWRSIPGHFKIGPYGARNSQLSTAYLPSWVR